MTVDPVTVAHSVDHLTGQLRRGRSEHRSLIRVDADALGIVLAELARTRPTSAGTPAPAGHDRKA